MNPPFIEFGFQVQGCDQGITPYKVGRNDSAFSIRESFSHEFETILPEATFELITIRLSRSETIKIPLSLLDSPDQFCLG
jgi:hypothetical protein